MIRAFVPSVALGALGLALTLSACAPTLGPPPPGPGGPGPGPAAFSAEAFAWSKASGAGAIAGRMTYRSGGAAYSCAGSSVVLTPETPWSRRRMAALYGPGERSALPADEVRARTPGAPAGDAGPYVRRTSCDAAGRFAFTGLPDGAWYAITIARPAGQPEGEPMAFMRRVVTRAGRTAQMTF